MDTKLICAVSRRFNNPKVDELYALHIEPVLQRYGIILTCDFASEDAANVDYWMNRMNVVLDLADIHIILDLNRSANTFYEFEFSNLSTSRQHSHISRFG
jgi:hypothetical protein